MVDGYASGIVWSGGGKGRNAADGSAESPEMTDELLFQTPAIEPRSLMLLAKLPCEPETSKEVIWRSLKIGFRSCIGSRTRFSSLKNWSKPQELKPMKERNALSQR
jgi:hypothetical protein